MTATCEQTGSFRAVRTSGLPHFDPALHRHDRGWPHPPPEKKPESWPRNRWKTVGIFHFPHHEEEDGEAEPGNAGSS